MYHLPVDVIFKMRMQVENTRNIKINRLELRLAAGMRTHEAQPRPVWVTLHVKAQSHSSSPALADSLGYDLVRHWMRTAWSRTPHAVLLEARIKELTEATRALAQVSEAIHG